MKSNRLFLRSLCIEDAFVTFEWRDDEDYKNGVVSQIRYSNLETEKDWIKQVINNHNSGKELRFAVVETESNALVGMVYLTNINYVNRTGVMGYMIGESNARGKGYAKEAVYLMMDYAFNQLGINRISAGVLASNESSLKAMKKMNFKEEGILRNAVFKNGKFIDLISYAILVEEFKQIEEVCI